MSNYYLTAEGDALTMKERVFIRDMARKVVKRFGKDALLVNIGVHRGGTLWCLRAGSGPGVRIIGIDINAESWPGDWEFMHGDSRRVHEDIEGPIHLLLVDGGKGQLGVAVAVLDEFNLLGRVPLVGLAKRREELFLPDQTDSILLPRRSQGLYLVQRVRDEAHRFAVSYHRQRRGKTGLASTLDAVPGVGPKRRTALLHAFGSIQKIRMASVDEIAAVPGIPRNVAEALKEQLG